MDERVSAAEANRNFSQLLRKVRDGRSIVVTSHGKPIAKLVPIDTEAERRREAKKRLLEFLDKQPVMNAGRWKREELYDE